MIEARYEADTRVCVEAVLRLYRLDKAHDAAEGHVEVVEAGRVDELVVEAAEAGPLRVVQDELKVDDVVDGHADILRHDVDNVRVVALRHGLERLVVAVLGGIGGSVVLAAGSCSAGAVQLGSDEAGDGEELRLLVRVELGGTVEVDGQGGDTEDGPVDLDEALGEAALAVADEGTAGDAQVAVEPGVPEPAAVRLDADLQEARVCLAADGLDAESGRVGVGSDHGKGVPRAPLGAYGESDDAGAVAGEVVLAAGTQGVGPVVTLLDQLKAGLFEQGGRAGDGMVSCSGGSEMMITD